MATINLDNVERVRVQNKPISKKLFVDLENTQNTSLTAYFCRTQITQIRQNEYGVKVFVFEDEQHMSEFYFEEFTDAEIIYTNY